MKHHDSDVLTALPPAPVSPPPTDRWVTADELLAHPEWGPCELIRGKVVKVCRPNSEHGLLVNSMSVHAGGYAMRNNLGYFFSGDAGVFLEHHPDTVRGPDLHFVRADRISESGPLKGYLEIPPDLCIEVLSPNDPLSKVDKKVREFLKIGVKLVWVFDPDERCAYIYRQGTPRRKLAPDGILSGEEILPGFELKLPEYFAILDVNKKE